MKTTYHLCWSCDNELLFRTREDYIHGIVCLCIAAHEAEMRLLAYCLMSNHVHICIRGSNLKKFTKAFRYSYTRYFNSKYNRRGRLGERNFFKLEIQGLAHLLTAIAYILRNPLHHGICKTPFEYEFSSVNAAFVKELGHMAATGKLPFCQLPSRHKLPSHVVTGYNGVPLAASIIDVNDIEHQFSTVRSYLYFMNRLSGESWEKEQETDKNGLPPIRLYDIEAGVKGTDITHMLSNENGRNRNMKLDDIALCELIEALIGKSYKGETPYTLPEKKLNRIAEIIKEQNSISAEQLSRCLPGLRYAKRR